MVGISWAGYLALRAAAYNILYDGFDCMVSQFPRPLKGLMRFLFHVKAERLMNVIMEIIAKKRFFVDRALSYGQYIIGAKTPYDFYAHLKGHTLKGIMDKIKCDILLLAGEHDHNIPISHFHILMK